MSIYAKLWSRSMSSQNFSFLFARIRLSFRRNDFEVSILRYLLFFSLCSNFFSRTMKHSSSSSSREGTLTDWGTFFNAIFFVLYSFLIVLSSPMSSSLRLNRPLRPVSDIRTHMSRMYFMQQFLSSIIF